VSSTSGTLTTSYTYDANGNLTAGAGRTITYSAANMPISITQGTKTLTFGLDIDHQRFKQTAPEGTTLYLAGFGIMVEKFAGSGGAVQWNEYLFAEGEMVGVRFEYNVGSPVNRYFHKDHLGSIATITDDSGTVVERDAFDAWGKRRFTNGNDDTTGSIMSQTTRGYTGHEELGDVGLVHMNGRVYDPLIGRFTSADPTVQQAYNSQGWNRYAYVQNNPLAFTDPNGYGFFDFLSHIFNPVQVFNDHIAIARAVYSVPYLGQVINIAATAVSAYFCGPCSIGVSAALSSLQTGVTGGSIGDVFKAGAISAATAAAFWGVGGATNGDFSGPDFGWSDGIPLNAA
jgi:RHS repeat-associated protein